MKKTRPCPRCRVTLQGDGLSCGECGWTQRADRLEARRQQAEHDPQRYQCAFEADGLRCRYPGSVNHGTQGSGAWYCRWHIDCDDGAEGARLVQESQGYRAEDPAAELAPEIENSLKRYGLERRTGESLAEHVKRLRNFCREGLARYQQGRIRNTFNQE